MNGTALKGVLGSKFQWFIGLLGALATQVAFATTIIGLVVSVADGDTLTILDSAKTQHRIRLAEIDAPEKQQPFGNRSKQSLADLCFKKVARIESQGTDRYARTIGRVTCDSIDANAEQVRRGMAWVYDKYVVDRSMYALQEAAQSARRGLWADPHPIQPWEWRRSNREPGRN